MNKLLAILLSALTSYGATAQSFPMLELITPSDGIVKKYGKVELAVRLPNQFNEPFHAFINSGGEEGTNPFDPAQIDIYVQFTHGTDTLIQRRMDWRIDYQETGKDVAI